MYTPVRVAAISIKPRKWDKPGNADKVEAHFRDAAKDRPDLILTTEGVLEGYVVMDVIEHPERAQEMLDIAEPIDGPYIRRFRRLARALSTCLCFGFAERVGRDVYNASVFIDGEGEIRGIYHKTQLAEGAHASWHFNRVGKAVRAFDTPIGRMGMLICNDRWNPTIARTLVLDGARLLLILSYGSKSRGQNQAVLSRARENGVPVVEANVGMNLIVSKGEIVAYKWGIDRTTSAVVDLPAVPSTYLSRRNEARYLERQGPEMERRYRETVKRLNGQANLAELAARGELIAERSRGA
jgi:predicted amidohydrolase